MILPDANILIHAYDVSSPHHEIAKAWWEDTVRREERIGIAWITSLAFIRITTNRSASPTPISARQSVSIVRSWLARRNVRVVSPGERHADILFDLLENLGTAGNLTPDAHLAAIAIEYQAEIATTDYDFARFPGLRWFNPLKGRQRR